VAVADVLPGRLQTALAAGADAVHKKPEPIDLGAMLRSEMTIIASQGYPTEIFAVTPDITEYQERFARLISHRVPFTDAARAFRLALTPRRRREGGRDLRRLTRPARLIGPDRAGSSG